MPNIFFSVGEPSGDLHAASLIRSLQSRLSSTTNIARNPLTFRGFGGPQMAHAGCKLDYELTNLAVVGFAEVLPKLREFFRVADRASDVFRQQRPDCVVLVDFPGFNWHIAKRAKQMGIPVVYYLPPQLWAWGAWRLSKMRKYVDRTLCSLPFEPQWYEKRGVQVDYVGHPFFDEVAHRRLDRGFMDQWGNHRGLQVVVLPGSRSREVKTIWPMQLEAIRTLSKKHPKARFLVACYRDRHCVDCRRSLTDGDKDLNIEFFVGRTSELIEIADCGLVKSGSVSLELMARKTPSVVVYHASRSLYAIGRCLVNLNSMTLPNMIAGETIMPEFLAVGSSSKAVRQATDAMDQLMGDVGVRESQRQRLAELSKQYGVPGASLRAGDVILETLGMAASDIATSRISNTFAA